MTPTRQRKGARRPTLIRSAALLAAAVLVLAACSSDSESSDESDTTTTAAGATTTTAASTDDAAADTTTTAAPSDDSGTESGGEAAAERAIVTIGSDMFEADLSGGLAVCIALGGAVGGVGPIVEPEGGTLDMTIPPENWESSADDWDAPSIRLDLGEDENGVPIDWRAGGEIVESMPDLAGKSQVDSFTVDGATASGTATFIDFFQVQMAGGGQVDDPEPVEGTFEINCS